LLPPDEDYKKAWLFGLAMGCPYGTAEEDCPVERLRCSPLSELMKMINIMTRAEMDAILEHHQQCRRRNEQERSA
jgi:hypothetical protein